MEIFDWVRSIGAHITFLVAASIKKRLMLMPMFREGKLIEGKNIAFVEDDKHHRHAAYFVVPSGLIHTTGYRGSDGPVGKTIANWEYKKEGHYDWRCLLITFTVFLTPNQGEAVSSSTTRVEVSTATFSMNRELFLKLAEEHQAEQTFAEFLYEKYGPSMAPPKPLPKRKAPPKPPKDDGWIVDYSRDLS